ncbi:MAG: tRNA (N6-isopentenyl adenosine(37)-C2)-methylthiotransferase MiaB [Patescibacteria group bacterium]|nr:tRNA (N6-isopentenyl adenosine(37)-C2)-methylthiotransferase MiaB [Patescibacteria group bacterium]
MKEKKKYYIFTYGCQMNVADSIWLEKIFNKCGYEKSPSYREADVILINSCSVRQAAEDKVYGLAKKVEKCRKDGKKPVVILTGCMAGSALGERQRIPEDILQQRMPWVNYFVAPQEIFYQLPEILLSDKTICKQVQDYLGLPGSVIFEDNGERKAYVPVMRGCDNFCSYCAVPFGRGSEISRPLEVIISEVKELVEAGITSITLLGQNVNSYGKNLENWSGKHPFSELLWQLNSLEGLEELWFITSNPWDFSDDLIDALALEKVRKYLHLPLQSGDDDILRKMNRPYTAKQYVELVKKIREKVPDIKLGTDIIVGFPGEAKEQFENTVEVVKKVSFDGAYIAMYSPRPGTLAAKLYSDNVPHSEKKRRHAVLSRVIDER